MDYGQLCQLYGAFYLNKLKKNPPEILKTPKFVFAAAFQFE